MGSDSAILKSLRDDLPPSSFLVKLSQLTNNKHESPHFSSGGFNWRMVIYPKGNEEENGSGFVSMYVECLSATPTPMDRITFSKVIENEWFKKGYKAPKFENANVSFDDVYAIFDDSGSLRTLLWRGEKKVLKHQ